MPEHYLPGTMTTDGITSPDDASASLQDLLADSARRTSDARLALYSGAGIVVVVAALLLRPGGWHGFAAAGSCLVAFGLWGIVDREAREHPDARGAARGALLFARGVLVALGALSALILVFALLSVTLGTWKS